MQIIFSNGYYKISRITGPKHNMLAIKYGDRASPLVRPYKSDSPAELDDLEVTKYVLEGVAQASTEVGVIYVVEEIRYVPDDSAPAMVYQELARHLTLAMHTGDVANID